MTPEKQRANYVKHNSGENVTFDNVTLGEETAKAVPVTINEILYWIPLSQVVKMVRSNVKGGDSITMTQWIAKKKELV